MKFYADRHRSERSFEPGDQLYLKAKPYRQLSLATTRYHKLMAKYYGPFLVLEKIGTVAYKLQLPANARIHPVFHVSLLKKRISKNNEVLPYVPEEDSSEQIHGEPIAILDRRMVKKGNAPHVKVLVQWSNTLPEEATWEDWDSFIRKYPTFHP